MNQYPNSEVNVRYLLFAFSDKTLQASSAASDSGFASQSDGYRSQDSTLAAWVGR